MTKRERIIMMKGERPKRVTLLNGRKFVARYQRVTCATLTANICLAWPYKERAAPNGRQRRQQQVVQKAHRIGSKLLKLVKKVAKTPVTQKTGKMALNELLKLYEKGPSKIKNKKIKKTTPIWCRKLLGRHGWRIWLAKTWTNFFWW